MSETGKRLREAAQALMGVSAYQVGQGTGFDLDAKIVEEIRKQLGGQMQQIPTTGLRWYLDDIERAQKNADGGNLELIGQLWRAMKGDGTLRGLLGTRTAGLIRLPKRFYGDAELSAELRAKNGTRSKFDDMHPPSELSALIGDGIGPGFGIAERVPVQGRKEPIMIRLDPEFLIYRWNENRWYYSSIAGLLPVRPGDGRWVLHIPGGRIAPWNSGLWRALARSYINKEHAIMNRANYAAKLANPARVAQAPQGASEEQKQSWFRKVMAWGTNTVFGLTPGYEVKLLESNGVGYEVFQKEIDTADSEYMICLLGQIVTTTGGTGFSNQDVQQGIRQDFIVETADAIAYTVNTQSLPAWALERRGGDISALEKGPFTEWTTDKPKDLKATAESLKGLGESLKSLNEALRAYKKRVELENLLETFGVTTEDLTDKEIRDLEEQVSANANAEPEKEDPAVEEAREKATKGVPLKEAA